MPGLEGVDLYPGHLEAQISLHLIFSCGVHEEHCVYWEDKEYPAPVRQNHISYWNCNTRRDSENVAGDRISFGRLQSYKQCIYWNVLR